MPKPQQRKEAQSQSDQQRNRIQQQNQQSYCLQMPVQCSCLFACLVLLEETLLRGARAGERDKEEWIQSRREDTKSVGGASPFGTIKLRCNATIKERVNFHYKLFYGHYCSQPTKPTF